MRYGSIRYVNNLPVDHALVQGHTPRPPGLDVFEGTPAQLNARMLARSLDVSAVSAVTLFGRNDLVALPEATIASHGPIDSVLLVSKVPFDALDRRTVAVTEDSATGALLLRILLERDVGVTPHYRTTRSDLGAMLTEADAALLIGDDALRASAGDPDPLAGYEVLDLGEAWRAFTGLPMVYALWVTRPAVMHANAAGVDALRRAIVGSVEWGRTHPNAIVEEAHRRTGVARGTLATYYGRLSHTLGAAERDGLARFAEEAALLANSATRPPLPDVLEAVA